MNDAVEGFRHINTDGVFDPSAIYSHVVIPPPGRVIFLAGQWGADVGGALVTGGFRAQVAQSLANVRIHLDALGLGPEHVVKVTHYVVDLDHERRTALHAEAGNVWPRDKPAATLLGVSRLAREEMLYEVDVQAVLPD